MTGCESCDASYDEEVLVSDLVVWVQGPMDATRCIGVMQFFDQMGLSWWCCAEEVALVRMRCGQRNVWLERIKEA